MTTGLGLERTEVSVCELCEYRFQCYTSRDKFNGLCTIEKFSELDEKTIREIQICKAKRQGHYVG
jgi:hypothetical protein